MISAGLSSGHVTAADWLFLIAMILFILGGVITYVAGKASQLLNPTVLLFAGLACVALAWLVL